MACCVQSATSRHGRSACCAGAAVQPALAQVPDPAPDASLPGGALITQVLGWLKYAAIAAAVAGLLIGGVATGVGHFGSNYSGVVGRPQVDARRDRRGDDRRAGPHDRHDRLQRDLTDAPHPPVPAAAVATAMLVVVGVAGLSTPPEARTVADDRTSTTTAIMRRYGRSARRRCAHGVARGWSHDADGRAGCGACRRCG